MNVFLMKIRFLSQTDKTSCILDQKNGKVKENQGNSSNEIVKLNNEIQIFMNDTYNEVNFYLDDQEINNSTEKCEKSSTYINWKGMDYVNLILNKEKNYNISNLVDCWNDKQEFFKTHIHKEINSTCNFRTFDYCALLNKNNNCSSPYENNNLLKSTSLTYEQLNDNIYYDNKTDIINKRRSQFDELTHEISMYYFKMYEKHNSDLNCGKWSMYIYKRGKQFVNMMTNEINSDEPYVQNYVNVWNSFSQNLQQYTLEQTKSRCNMTALLHKIIERENSTNPYDLSWINLDNNHIGSNKTLNVAISIQHNSNSTNGTLNISYDIATTHSIDNTTHTTSIEPLTSGTTFFTTEHQPAPTKNTIKPNENSTISFSVNKSSSNTNTSSTTIASLSTDDTISPLTDETIHSPISISTPKNNSEFPTSSSSFEIVHSSNNTTPSTINTISPITVPSPSPKNGSSLSTTSTAIIDSASSNIATHSLTQPSINRNEPSANNSTSSNDTTTHSPTIIEPFKNSTIASLTNITSPTIGSPSSSEIVSSPKVKSSTTTNSSFSSNIGSPTPYSHIIRAAPSANDSISPLISNTTNSTNNIKFPRNNTRSLAAPKNISTTLSSEPLLSSFINTSLKPITKSPTTNSGIPSLGINNPITQNPQNTSSSFILAKQILPLNITQNSTLGNNANANLSNLIVPKNDIKPTKSDNPINDTPEITPTGNVLIIVPIGIFILGIIFLLILLCKYTFIGSWFRKRKSKKKKIRKNMKEISKEPLLMSLNDMESEPIYSGKYSLSNHEKQMPLCEISFESERNLKYRQMKTSKECGDKRVYEAVEEVSKYKNELPIKEEKLKEDDSKNEIEEDELNKNKSRSKIRKEKFIKSGLKKNAVHVVGYVRENTLNEEEKNEINVKSEKSTYENEMKNSENKMPIKSQVYNWNTWVNIHIIALLEYKKKEWELIKNEFLKICIEEFEKDEKNTYPKEVRNNLLKKREEENSIVVRKKYSSILDKWKKEEWFINLKKEWKKEEEKHLEYLEEQEIEKVEVEGISNLMLDKKKKAWRKWIEKQRERSNEYKKQEWFKKLLEEYEKEGISKNIIEEKIEKISVKKKEKVIDNETYKYEMKKNLTKEMLIDIHMMVLEECTKEELEREKDECFKTNIQELGTQRNLEEVNILEKIWEERSWNSILEKKKQDIEKWKREKWFVELMLEWKDNEQKYIEELNKKMLEEKNEERKTNIALERQYIIWKKHWEDMRKKWIENDNKEEWFTKLVDEIENKEKEYINEISINNIEKKRESEKPREGGESIIEINGKVKEEIKKFEKTQLEDEDEKVNSIIRKKKLKWKTIIEIHMIILEECKKDEWLFNRGKFLEACLEEFKKEDKEKHSKIIENDLDIMMKGEEDISAIMVQKQNHLWKKWIERNKSMLEKWKKEEWFINLKKEWEKEQEKYEEVEKESEIIKIEVGKNSMLEKQEKIWKQWLKKQRMWFLEHSSEKWFDDLLDEYKKEKEYMKELTKGDVRKIKKINQNIEELEQDISNEMEKSRKKKKLIQKVLIEIHMMVLEECKKEEMEKEKEGFFNTIMKELKIQENLDKEANILEKIGKERSFNSILEKKEEDIKKWRKEKWFVELMLEMKNKEKKYMKEISEEILAKKNEGKIKNSMLVSQKFIWKKHWEDINKKWIEKENKELF
ncbi:surface-associated interspersed protein (SURFIN) [Plasmodium gallinaceum]|uniref:Surface-associated interspersed protein (SURFIN) n=1 Tax=Plasmodium gallinaceum TaxID=5849 RepID=A0A1J1GUM1_PLAGA|nr:surface-associated interspersed protein (SURFIN) [Plasmodium gallinaceum]CRG96001.1 surface-associated interspersed protein (SURFIN) [Plasmodium gallinaceum]